MAREPLHLALRRLRNVLVTKDAAHWTDAELVRHFVERHDEAAFAVLVRRHGGLVLHACRRVLFNGADAEDAFQSTFLVLARKAASLRKTTSLATWLYGVAFRCARNLRKNAMRRQKRERTADSGRRAESPVSRAALNEMQSNLDEAIEGLPEIYRAPFLLCYLEGKSRSEAARALGCKEGTVASRLARARQILQKQLTARGVTLSSALAAVTLSPCATSASASLVGKTTQAALAFAAGNAVVVSSQVLAAAQGTLNGLLVAKLKLAAILFCAAFLTVSAAGGLVAQLGGAETAKKNATVPPQVFAKNEQSEPNLKPQPQTDAFGDPLPNRAVARLGTERFRQRGHASALAFTPDGKSLVCAGDGIIVWDAASGIERFRIPARFPGRMAMSLDGTTLAFSDNADSTKLILSELKAGGKSRDLLLPKGERADRLVGPFFAPDGKSLTVGCIDSGRILVFDTATGGLRLDFGAQDGRACWSLALSPDGQSLAAAVSDRSDPLVSIQLMEFSTGKPIRVIHKRRLGDKPYAPPAAGPVQLAFSPDGKKLAIGCGSTILLTDPATGEQLSEFDATNSIPKLRFDTILDLKFTPDSAKLLYLDWVPGGIHVLDVASKKKLRAFDGQMATGTAMAISADGRTVALGAGGTVVRQWDIGTGKERFTEYQSHEWLIAALAFSPDGKTLASSGSVGQTCLWDVATWNKTGETPWGADKLSFSPDGKQLAAAGSVFNISPTSPMERSKLRIWDLNLGKESQTMSAAEKSHVLSVRFSPDGRKLFTSDKVMQKPGAGTFVRRWDLATGTQEQSWTMPNDPIAFVRHGKSVFAAKAGAAKGKKTLEIMMLDLDSGRERLIGPGYGDFATLPTPSPDGRFFAVGVNKNAVTATGSGTRIYEMATGKEVAFVDSGPDSRSESFAWSPDARLLAIGTDRRSHELNSVSISASRNVRIWDTATGDQCDSFGALNANVSALTLSPDGKLLACGLANGTVLIFDVSKAHPKAKPRPPLAEAEREANWADLGGDDAGKATRAAWSLVDDANQSLHFLARRLKPTPFADGEKIQRWIDDLESSVFAVRDSASKQLLKAGETAELLVERSLAKELPLETRRRLKQVLDTITAPPAPETLRTLRAIMVLERIGTREARSVLESLARGIPGARVTEEAAAALQRLTMTAPPP